MDLDTTYSWFHENGFLSVHSFNEHYLSIQHYTGSWGNRFQETQGIHFLNIFYLNALIDSKKNSNYEEI